MEKHKIYSMSVSSVYPHYVKKVEKKGRTKEDVDEAITWLTGYDEKELEQILDVGTDFETVFNGAPNLKPNRRSMKGVICCVRVEYIEESIMQEIRYLDKLIYELKGKK